MSSALTAPFAVAAVVLCAAGLAKLRAPSGAVRALMVTGLPARAGLVRALAIGEVAIGGFALVRPSPWLAGAVAGLYASFCVLSLALARRRAGCGCFGEGDAPASVLQSLLSGALCLVAVAAAVAPAHGIGWVLDAGAGQAGALIVGIGGAAYATVIAYTVLPQAWAAWSGP
jgi:hypothetical protein